MMSFLKSFLSGEKSADERALQDNMQAAKKRDVIALAHELEQRVGDLGDRAAFGDILQRRSAVLVTDGLAAHLRRRGRHLGKPEG